MSGLDFRMVDTGDGYRLDALTEKGRAYLAGLPAGTPDPLVIEHDGWLPLAFALRREGYTVQMVDLPGRGS